VIFLHDIIVILLPDVFHNKASSQVIGTVLRIIVFSFFVNEENKTLDGNETKCYNKGEVIGFE
jgi:hypothetical protein